MGLCMGIFLKQLLAPDQKVILLDKKTTTTSHPQAHYLNLRTMEIFLSTMPHVHDRIQALATPIDEVRRVVLLCISCASYMTYIAVVEIF